MEIFVPGSHGPPGPQNPWHLWHLYQTSPNGDWSDWEDLSEHRPLGPSLRGNPRHPAVGSAADGRLEVFINGDDGHLWHLYQTLPNGDWSNWEDLSVHRPLGPSVTGNAGGAVGSAADGRLEIFVPASGDGVWHLWHLYQTSPNGDWSDWEDLNVHRPLGIRPDGRPAVGSAADGRLEIFVPATGDGRVYHLWHLYQTSPNGDWSDWEDLNVHRPLGVDINCFPGVGSAADGRLEVFVIAEEEGHVWHLYQTSPNGDWTNWEDLSVHRPLGVRVAGEAAVGRAGSRAITAAPDH